MRRKHGNYCNLMQGQPLKAVMQCQGKRYSRVFTAARPWHPAHHVKASGHFAILFLSQTVSSGVLTFVGATAYAWFILVGKDIRANTMQGRRGGRNANACHRGPFKERETRHRAGGTVPDHGIQPCPY